MVDVKDKKKNRMKGAVRKAHSWLVFGLLFDPKLVAVCSSETGFLRTLQKTALFNMSVSCLLLKGLSYK
jgi:hypothetical protein